MDFDEPTIRTDLSDQEWNEIRALVMLMFSNSVLPNWSSQSG